MGNDNRTGAGTVRQGSNGKVQVAETSVRESLEALRLELTATQQLQETSTMLIREESPQVLYEQILDAAVTIMRSDFASMQTLERERDPAGELHLLGFRGFSPEAAAFWEWVRPGSKSTCGIVMDTHERFIVRDVEQCELMAGSEDLDVYRQTGIRAVQSTPLLSRGGRLLGMLSTHWNRPHQPADVDLHLLDVLARQAADFIERSQVQAALESSGQRFRALAEAIPVIVWTAGADGRIDWYNNRWYEYTGLTRQETIGWGWQAVHHPDDIPRVMEAWKRATTAGQPLEIESRLRRHDNLFHHFLTQMRPFRNEYGEIVCWYGSNVDIQAQVTALEQSQRVVKALQSRFLPRVLPHTDKVRFDASYTAAEEHMRVGGDWFEATQLPDGRYLISIGDVTGHGIEASIIADRLRQAITDFGFIGEDPATILARVNRVLRFQSPDVYATAVVGFIDRDCEVLTYATAGHPPPLLATSWAMPAEALEYGGLPLGFGDELGLESHSIGIAPGTVLAFYTDGLTEFARDSDAAENGLKNALAELVGDESVANPATVLKEKILDGVHATDDVALLVVQVH